LAMIKPMATMLRNAMKEAKTMKAMEIFFILEVFRKFKFESTFGEMPQVFWIQLSDGCI
jgi:hypothetical protein